MRTAFLFFTLVFTFSVTFAQEESGYGFNKSDFFVSGTMGYNNSKYKGDFGSTEKGHILIIEPEIGFFIHSNIAIGTRLSVLTNTSKNSNNYEIEESGYGVGVFGKYFFTPKKKFSIYAELSAAYRTSEREQKITLSDQIETRKSENKGYNIAISPGMQFFVSKRLALTSRIGSISYNSSDNENTSPNGEKFNSDVKNFSINLGLDNIYFGVLYRF
ncbi:outer membrane beta-barrel protein [Aquimarina megaterium]|uniref:outer membrane beta-barrel protein n=1 Tax=Aquimarina megaterium TaxID=1443666 RepID=UPI00094516E0|nr:outer membrane beta-barrel protein [Aquimarina megaterium]